MRKHKFRKGSIEETWYRNFKLLSKSKVIGEVMREAYDIEKCSDPEIIERLRIRKYLMGFGREILSEQRKGEMLVDLCKTGFGE